MLVGLNTLGPQAVAGRQFLGLPPGFPRHPLRRHSQECSRRMPSPGLRMDMGTVGAKRSDSSRHFAQISVGADMIDPGCALAVCWIRFQIVVIDYSTVCIDMIDFVGKRVLEGRVGNE